jgi:hypothetical protein
MKGMRIFPLRVVLFLWLCPVAALPACIPFTEAGKHIGETRCITGRVMQVSYGSKEVTHINFCEDYRVCAFSVVVFRGDLKHVGDVRQLQGRTIEVNGLVKLYDGHAEIILRRASQLTGEAAQIPPLPKGYDVEQKGKFSAGKFGYPSSRKPAKQKQGQPVEIEQSEENE